LKLEIEESEKQKVALKKETREIEREKVKLAAEVGGKEESLIRLAQIGLLDEDLIRLRTFLETSIEVKTNNSVEVRDEFFVALGSYKDIKGLNQEKETYIREVRELTQEKSLITD